MKKLLVTISVALVAAMSFGGAADARPGKGKGHGFADSPAGTRHDRHLIFQSHSITPDS